MTFKEEFKAVAVFNTRSVKGVVIFSNRKNGLHIEAEFTQLPKGKHGFHIHKAGDLRGEGCKLACDHYHKEKEKGVPCNHGGPPSKKHNQERHTGDLGNVEVGKYTYTLHDVSVEDIIGRSVIVHADEDDYGLGNKEDSLKTGHSGARIACAIIGRVAC
jgi:Cu-Zn family superoxide dismutase